MELALGVLVSVSWPQGLRAGELVLPPAEGQTWYPSWSSVEEFTLVVQIKNSVLTSLATIESQIQVSELVRPEIYIIY